MNDEYKELMESLNYDFYKQYRMQYSKFVKTLKKMSYGENVIKDEIQAYMSTSKKSELVEEFGLDYNTILPMIRKYRKVLSRYNTSKKKT
jgi:hypothetical protein